MKIRNKKTDEELEYRTPTRIKIPNRWGDLIVDVFGKVYLSYLDDIGVPHIDPADEWEVVSERYITPADTQ